MDQGVIWLGKYFSNPTDLGPFAGALETSGTRFQERVWAALRAIPHGHTVTYGQLATTLGNPNASRAVGSANGRNPIPIITPCHRVIAQNGLGGFSAGLDRKRWLLAHEKQQR